MTVEIRRFQRSDRDQVTGLVNAHVTAVVPGVSVPVNAVMSQLERDPGEFIVDPWVVERQTFVAVERDAVVAGAHLLRYGSDESVGDSYRNTAEVRWLVCKPEARQAGDSLLQKCSEVMDGWGVGRQYADGSLPALATYGVPACWPHIRSLYRRAGFLFDGHVEVILASDVDRLPEAPTPPIPGLEVLRSVGNCGTRFSAMLDEVTVGVIEVETDMTEGGTRSRLSGWGDVGNLHTIESFRRKGVGTWLVGTAADWLR
ncbi:MAG: N-acetyltransferase, partial [Actinobacteria bacterium]|nr:N-acetyltransferase [Actinomycetota bacterium]